MAPIYFRCWRTFITPEALEFDLSSNSFDLQCI